MKSSKSAPLYRRVRGILESARVIVARSVNSTQVVANWLVGREIVEEEQQGRVKAEYGAQLLADLSKRLKREYGNGYSVDNLELFRRFYYEYPVLLSEASPGRLPGIPISDALRRKLREKEIEHGYPARVDPKYGALLQISGSGGARVKSDAVRRKFIPAAAGGTSWAPGTLHPNLSWTHYRALLRMDKAEARAFYEIEAVRNNWAARELERQINSLLYERLAASKNRKGLMRLSVKGHEVQHPADIFKDPVVIEFLGLPESPRLVESDLEEALIGNLQAFLLELGKGFAFVARQQRLTLDGDHFYIDLVFYHTILKCYVIVELKTSKLTHQDLGQLQLYVNYFDRERRTKGDGPTLGLILCTDKNDAVVKYTLGPGQKTTIFASRYKLYLPTEVELKSELRRELKSLRGENS